MLIALGSGRHFSLFFEMFMPVQYRGLRAFCFAARNRSFKTAADELCLSPSAISHQIRDLEAYLGVKLFERQVRSIELTQPGQDYFEALEPLMRDVDLITESMRTRPDRCTLKVEIPDFFASELFVPKMAEFSVDHPDLDLQIESGSAGGVADVQIILTGRHPENPAAHRLFPIHYVPACSAQQYACLHRGGIEAIRHSTLLVHKARPHAWHRWAKSAGLSDLQPKHLVQLESMYALARATEQGVGIGLIPMPVSDNWFESGSLVRLLDDDLLTTDYYYVATSGESDHPEATRILWQWIVDTFKSTISVHA